MERKFYSSIWLLLLLFITPIVLFSQAVEFEKYYIDSNFKGIHCIKIADLDADGDYDIIGGSEHTPSSTSVGLAWWRNDGGTPINWTKFVIDNSFLHVMSVDVKKINSDNSLDIVASSWENGMICWWESSGDPTQGWTRHTVISGWTNPHSAICGDFDKDGKQDIVGLSTGNNKISVFYNDNMSTNSWNEHVLSASYSGALNATVADIDDDNDLDIISGNYSCNMTIWWENLGGQSWSENVITHSNGNGNNTICDVNEDGQYDLIGSCWARDEISYWTCNSISSNDWTKNTISSSLGIAVKGIGRDMNLDGDIDIIAVGKDPGELSIFYNNGNSFTKRRIESAFSGGSALAVFDLDQDGDDDIIAGAGILGDLCFFENVGAQSVDIEQLDDQYSAKIYPNPATNEITIDIPNISDQFVEVKIYDTNGAVIVNKKFFSHDGAVVLDLSMLPGVYITSIGVGNQMINRKLIVSNE